VSKKFLQKAYVSKKDYEFKGKRVIYYLCMIVQLQN
jgi:actin-related protein